MGLSSDVITCLFEDRAGTLWIGTDGGGVNAFSQGRVTTYTIAQGLPSTLMEDHRRWERRTADRHEPRDREDRQRSREGL